MKMKTFHARYNKSFSQPRSHAEIELDSEPLNKSRLWQLPPLGFFGTFDMLLRIVF